MSALIRQTFKTSRLAEFCSQKELVSQTGHEVADWPLVILKELLDNALDGCEEAGIAPAVTVTIGASGITVADNGLGIAAATVADITDYNFRTSSREAYVSPTRGAQGNALKTILAMPFALDGERGETIIESHGVKHTIAFGIDRIRQVPQIELTQEPCSRVNGTKIAVAWPHCACSILTAAWPQIVPFVGNYAALNPHMSLTLVYGADAEVGGGKWPVDASDPDWTKWRPSEPTSAHWYDTERLGRLIGAYIGRAKDKGEPVKTVREFVGEFRGLTRNQTRADVCDAIGAARWTLDQFFGGGTDLRRTGKLLDEMKRHSTPVLPKNLGVIGHEHFADRFAAFGVEPSTFEYRSAKFNDWGIPYVVEAAFGYCPKGDARRIISGVNWSAAIGDPFRKLQPFTDASLGSILTACRAGQEQPIIFALHVACPRVEYLDRGKSAVALPDLARGYISTLVIDVTKRWTKQIKAEERDASARRRRDDAMIRRETWNQKEAAAEVLEDAYNKVSDNGKLPANARQIYYAARPGMLRLTDKDTIDYDYFAQTLLIDFMKENEELCAGWDVVWDDRGHFAEPHGGALIGLGTLSVRAYLDANHDLEIEDAGYKDVKVETGGAHGRFGAILFVEKEGFDSLFRAARLADRFDIGIMSSKGVSVTAARQLADRVCGERGIPLLTLHDLDVAGFTIGQIGEDNRRYTYENAIKVINIGLRHNDIIEIDGADIDAMAEPCDVRGDKREALEGAGATDDEIDFLLGEREFRRHGSRRIELNALTSRQLVDLVERRLEQHGIKKIIPEAGDLAEAFRAYTRAPKIKEAIEKAIADIPDDAVEVPADLKEQVKTYLEENPECPWEEAVAEIVKSNGD